MGSVSDLLGVRAGEAAITPVDTVQRQCGLLTGTRLLTPAGYRPIEALAEGDLVRVLLRGEARFEPVTWIGQRDVILSRRARAEPPVRVRRHAFANDVPNQDLYLAPEHAVYFQGKLFRIGDLVNGGSIVWEKGRKSARYWAVMLDKHNTVLAENLPVESLLPINAILFRGLAQDAGQVWVEESEGPHAVTDLEAEARAVLASLAGELAAREVRVEFAVLPGLNAPFPAPAFRDMLAGLLRHVIAVAPFERVLLVGSRKITGPVLTLTFEGGASDAQRHMQSLQAVEQTAALHGAKLHVEALEGMGVAASLRLIGP